MQLRRLNTGVTSALHRLASVTHIENGCVAVKVYKLELN